MTAVLPRLLVLGLVATSVAGCAIDKTRQSVTWTMQEEIDGSRERARSLEKDLGVERGRVDAIEQRSANASKRLADSGATLETFLDELTAIRGELSQLQYSAEQSGKRDDDLSMRLSGIEYQVANLAQQVGVTLAAPPMDPGPADPAVDGDPPGLAQDGDPAGPAQDGDPGHDPATLEPPAVTDLGEDAVLVTVEAPPGVDDDFSRAVTLVKARRWDDAGALLQTWLRANRGSEHSLEAQYLMGQCLFELSRYKNAITEFQKVIEAEDKLVRKGGEALWASRAMFMQGLAFEELGTKQDLEAAGLFFEELIRIYPASPEAERARRRLDGLHGKK